ncbi:methionine aminotransferase [Sediminicola sp. 1XM1-17]|uniref:methionine aminotransferase n=1 Tax=Sediminicola sp. 1XM1-17 TaxID=3127702 RepID=UPI00307688E0
MPNQRNPIHSKLPQVGTTIFTTMSRLAADHKALNLSQGFPNFPPDPLLVQLATEAIQGDYNQYAPMQGIFPLREAISEKIQNLHGIHYHPETEITITAGATQAIYTAISTFVRPHDEVIVVKPAYDCYEPAIAVNGGIPVYVQLQGKDYHMDWTEFRDKINPKTKMVIINTPHNPTGKVFSKEDMFTLQEILKNTDIVLLSDEVYEHIVFDGTAHHSACAFPDLAERSIICASFGKTFHITGWKMGYCIGPKELMQELQKVHQFNVFCANHPLQRALTTYLKNPAHYLDLNNFYQGKRDLFLNGLKGSKFRFTPAQGTYFQLLDYSLITEEPDHLFAERLAMEHKIASIPVSGFNLNQTDHHQLRFCFAKTDDTLHKAIDILRKV